MMRRREFITLIGGAAVWSLTLQAQQSGRLPRIGVLVGYAHKDPLAEAHIVAFRQGLQQLGWRENTIHIDIRFAAADPDRMRAYAAELVEAAPEVILTMTTPVTTAVLSRVPENPCRFRHCFRSGR
jgi:putative ABC transport system substrate-binding protein